MVVARWDSISEAGQWVPVDRTVDWVPVGWSIWEIAAFVMDAYRCNAVYLVCPD